MKNKLLFNNKYNSGAITYLIFKEKNQFVGVCLEFDLVVRALTFKEAEEQIEDYAGVWLENVVENHLPETLLNKPAPKKYWQLYKQTKLEEEARKKQASISKPLIFTVAHPVGVENHLTKEAYPYDYKRKLGPHLKDFGKI